MKGVFKDELNAREINGLGFVQRNLIFYNLDETITHNKITTNHSTVKTEEQVLHLVEYIVSSEKKM